MDFQNSGGEVRNWSAFTEKPFIYEFYPEKYISNLSSQDLGYHYKTRDQLTLYLRSYSISEENVSIYLDGISDYLTDNQLNFLEENSYVNGKHDFFFKRVS